MSGENEPEHVYTPEPGKGIDTFEVTLNYYDKQFRADSVKDTVYVFRPVAFKKDRLTFCDGDSVKIQLKDTINPGKKFIWQDLETKDSFQASVYVKSAGFYSVKVEDYHGCTSEDSIKVVKHFAPAIKDSLGKSDTVCDGKQLELKRDNASILWSTGDTATTVTVEHTDTFMVQVTNDLGCTARDSIFVKVNKKPDFDLDSNFSVCEGAPLKAVEKNWDSVIWTNTKDTFINSPPIINAADTGWYYAKMYKNKCMIKDSTFVSAIDTPNAAFSYRRSSIKIDFKNQSKNYNSVFWNFGDGQTSTKTNPTHSFQTPDSTLYNVHLKASSECAEDDTMKAIWVSPTGLNNNRFIEEIKAFPNPFSRSFKLEIPKDFKDFKVQLLNYNGIVVKEDLKDSGKNIRVNGLPDGIYFIALLSKDAEQLLGTKKVIKQ